MDTAPVAARDARRPRADLHERAATSTAASGRRARTRATRRAVR